MSREDTGTTTNYGASSIPQLTGDFTFAGWVNPDDAGDNLVLNWCETPGSTTQDKAFGLNGGVIIIYVFDGAQKAHFGLTDVTVNAWNHIAARHDVAATNMDVFLNGEEDGGGPKTGVAATYGGYTSPELTVFRARTNEIADGGFNGHIGELGLWTAALSDNEIKMLYAGVSPLRVQPDKLLRYFPFFASGNGMQDFSGQGGDLTLNGTLLAGDHPPVAAMFGGGTWSRGAAVVVGATSSRLTLMGVS